MSSSTSAPIGEREIQITVPAANKAEVVASFDPADFGKPTGREEDWRFTPLRRLRSLLDPIKSTDGFAGGWDAPDGVVVELADADDPRLGQSLVPTDRISALAWAGATTSLIVTVPRRVELTEPIVLKMKGDGCPYDKVRVIVESDAIATVIADYFGGGSRAGNVEVSVGDRSQLTYISVQDGERDSVYASRIHSQIGRDASLTQVVATFGSDLVRLVSTAAFDGPGGSVELLGAFFSDAGQHHEHRLFVDHNVPNCRSRAVYKGALQGEHAHSVWIGDVLIRSNATGTDTYEINRNLVLTDGARADSVPNLEIETGEVVGAGHASATGRFDDEQLFYLQARGIPVVEARRLVVRGFFADVIDRVPDEAIRERLWRAIETEIEAVGAGDEEVSA